MHYIMFYMCFLIGLSKMFGFLMLLLLGYKENKGLTSLAHQIEYN
jgi:hypothetical protein